MHVEQRRADATAVPLDLQIYAEMQVLAVHINNYHYDPIGSTCSTNRFKLK